MRSLKKVTERIRQFGGLRLMRAYVKAGMGGVMRRQLWDVVRGRESVDEAYGQLRNAAAQHLLKQYSGLMALRSQAYKAMTLEQRRSDKVWVCWLQGFDKAPELVKMCVASMRKYLIDKEIVLVSYQNYRDYVELPNHIVEKYEKGMIPPALFADLLRLELLIRHGGTWMDASMLCTGSHYPKEIMDCDLFMFQALRKGDPRFYGTSNWFITACTNNGPLMVLRDVLLQYWRDYDCTMNYYMFHDFFFEIAKLFPEEIAAMPRKNRLLPLMLLERNGSIPNKEWLTELKKRCCFHKLNYRLPNMVEIARIVSEGDCEVHELDKMGQVKY